MIIFGVNYTPFLADLIALVVVFLFCYGVMCWWFKGFNNATRPIRRGARRGARSLWRFTTSPYRTQKNRRGNVYVIFMILCTFAGASALWSLATGMAWEITGILLLICIGYKYIYNNYRRWFPKYYQQPGRNR